MHIRRDKLLGRGNWLAAGTCLRNHCSSHYLRAKKHKKIHTSRKKMSGNVETSKMTIFNDFIL